MEKNLLDNYNLYLDKTSNNYVAVAKYVQAKTNDIGIIIYRGSYAQGAEKGDARCEAGIITSLFLTLKCEVTTKAQVHKHHPKLIAHLRRLHKAMQPYLVVAKRRFALLNWDENKLNEWAFEEVLQARP